MTLFQNETEKLTSFILTRNKRAAAKETERSLHEDQDYFLDHKIT